jgi:hypothetical protein
MLWKYGLKEASWYLDNPVKETIWTAIVKKMVYSHWSGSIIQLLPLYKGLNFITVENLKTVLYKVAVFHSSRIFNMAARANNML